MAKPLQEMTNEELWQLFPIRLQPHNPAWRDDYRTESARIVQALGAGHIARISHIGSTAVPGLTAKPTVDILLEIRPDVPVQAVTAAMEQIGYIYAPQPDKPPPHMMFMKGYTPAGFDEKVCHLHIRYPGDPDELYFRDYLRGHPEVAREYAALKQTLAAQFEKDRDAYTNAKHDFVRRITQEARLLYPNRYTL